MARAGAVERTRYGNVTLRIFTALLTTGLTYLITSLASQPRIWVSTVSVLIGGFTLLAQFLHGFDKRLECVEEKQEDHSVEVRSLIKEGFARTSKAEELFQSVDSSALRTETILQLVRNCAQIMPDSSVLVCGFAQAQIGRLSQLLKELGEGGQVSYDGEDRDWILELTRHVQGAIDATSLSTVDADATGFGHGLWGSNFGQRYLELQREAINRGVTIRRIFVFDSPGQIKESEFLRVYRQQRDLGIHAKVLERLAIPPSLTNLLYDFIVFDGILSYEVTAATRVDETISPTIIRTNLALEPQRVRERIQRFNYLWAAAREFDPL